MVDIVISSANVTLSQDLSPRQTVWLTPSIGYTFYLRTTPTRRVVYRKTTDKWLTSGPEVILDDANTIDNTVNIWYEPWTRDDEGTLIHIVMARFSTFRMEYISLNTATDVLSAPVVVDSGAFGTSVSHSIAKTPDGTLFITQNGGNNAGMDVNLWRSIDGGLNWVGRSVVGAQMQRLDGRTKIVPANTADDNIGAITVRTASSSHFYAEYDNNSDTWSSVALFTGTIQENQFQLTVRHSDGHMMAALKDAGFDIRVFDINNVGDVVEQAQPVTGAGGAITVGIEIMVNQNNNDIFVIYPRGIDPAITPRSIRYRKSADGMVTWEPEVVFSVANGDQSGAQAGISIGPSGGRFQPTWHDEDTNSWLTNLDNSLEFTGIPTTPPSPAPIIVGSPNQQAGTILYITPAPESRVYELITPHDPGRWVMSFSGFGTPPIEYITQRGPFQDGETVKDFFLRPRVVQMVLRQNFKDRDAWWDGRAAILDEIRPNRQATATAVVPGVLRMVKTDGSVRDLNVFIQEGPRFEPRQSGQWDEWSFQENLRFVAHDPILFDPTRVDFAFTIVLDADLVFPITFPITFGAGEIDLTPNINYTGTWSSLPIIVVTGPIEDFRIDNITTGEKLELSINVPAGRVVTINTTEGFKTVTDDLGNNLIGGLTSDSDLATFHIAPDPEAPLGVNAMRLQGKHPSGATSVEVRYFTRFFGI
ncbi:hypothetical protein LCGC14_0353650 [marine sediment metagenome]|uniref:Uncharacterized protein n=1 Tax=marine sediment metagenome TaxID=412755 RepID=A0A0F9WI86_9ZZZZ